MAKPRVVRARSWSELPDILEPGEYYVDGEKIVVKERVGKDALKRTIVIMKRRGGKYV